MGMVSMGRVVEARSIRVLTMSLLVVYSLQRQRKVVVSTKTSQEISEEYGRPFEILTQMSEVHDMDAAKRHVQMVSPKGYEIVWEVKSTRKGGWSHSDETKEKMRQAKLGNVIPEETRRKISQTMKG